MYIQSNQNSPSKPTIQLELLDSIHQKTALCGALGKNTKSSVTLATQGIDKYREIREASRIDAFALPDNLFHSLVELPLFNGVNVDRKSLYFQYIAKMRFKTNDSVASSEIYHAGQYALLNASKRLLKDKTLTKARTIKGEHYTGGKERFKYRVQMCQAFRLDADKSVFVAVNNETGKANFGNLVHCSSAWVCPICNAKIMARRRQEIELAEQQNKEMGGRVLMLTLTHSHSRDDALADLLDKQAKALKILWENTALKNMMQDYQYIGLIRGMEMTWGQANGWHPHYHILLHFADADIVNALETLKSKIFEVWQNACSRAKLGLPNDEHGVDLKAVGDADGEVVSGYLDDGISWEVVSSQTKRAGNGRYNQWQILAMSSDDAHFAGLWREYAEATFGKRMIYFSPNLKRYYNLEVKKEEEITNADDDNKTIVRHFTDIEWQAIRYYKAQAKILILARVLHQTKINFLDDEIARLVYRYEKSVMANRYGQVLVGYSPDGRALIQ